ncbi:MAG: anti-sigma factor antagonist [Planctomycetota bacterium]|nr:MAG: anti-sigma factor antagonist [Planctomycetota bacterium]
MVLRITYPLTQVAAVRMPERGSEDLVNAVEDMLKEDIQHIILDYQDVQFSSSVEIAEVLVARSMLVERGGRLDVVHLCAQMRSIFQVLKLDRLFDLDRDMQGLLEELSRTP